MKGDVVHNLLSLLQRFMKNTSPNILPSTELLTGLADYVARSVLYQFAPCKTGGGRQNASPARQCYVNMPGANREELTKVLTLRQMEFHALHS